MFEGKLFSLKSSRLTNLIYVNIIKLKSGKLFLKLKENLTINFRRFDNNYITYYHYFSMRNSPFQFRGAFE